MHSIRKWISGWTIPLLFLAACRTELSPQEEEDAQYITENAARLFQEGKGTLYEYASNAICMNETSMRVLRGQQTGDRTAAVRRLAVCMAKIRQGMEWNVKLPELEIPCLKHLPVPDGSISTRELEECLVLRGEHPLGKTEKDPRYPDSLWLTGWKDDMLYLAVSFRDEQPEFYHGKNDCTDGKYLYLGDCLEFFIRPQLHKLQYFELLMNPAGNVWMLSHVPGYWGGFTPVDRDCPASGAVVKGAIHNGFYTIEAILPFRIWHGEWCSREPRPGDAFSFMMLRANRSGTTHTFSTPLPFLYNGHNLYGYIRATLGAPLENEKIRSGRNTRSGNRKHGVPVSRISK